MERDSRGPAILEVYLGWNLEPSKCSQSQNKQPASKYPLQESQAKEKLDELLALKDSAKDGLMGLRTSVRKWREVEVWCWRRQAGY